MVMADVGIGLEDPTQFLIEVRNPPGELPLRTVAAAPFESQLKGRLFPLIALAFTAGLWFFLFSFCAPAPGRIGVDENAYLVGGRMLAEHGTTGFKPSDDYQFVGAMWVRTSSGWY